MSQPQTSSTTTKREHVLIINGQPATDAEYARVMNAKPKKQSRAKANTSTAFSVLR